MPPRVRLPAWATSGNRKHRWSFLLLSYAPDWIVSAILSLLFWYLGKLVGFRRLFSLTDTSIQYPHSGHDRVPGWALIIICLVAPVVLIPVISLLTRARGVADIHAGWLGLIVSLAITGSVTNLVKILVGRPRPDMLAICQPRLDASNAPIYGLASSAVCTAAENYDLKDAFRSFPSGHSSLSFAGLGFLTFFLAGKLHLWDHIGSGLKAWLTITPVFGAALVAISRTMDYRHHATDVLAGSLLGIVVAYFTYRQYFPPINNNNSHVCYPPRRSPVVDAVLPTAYGDNERARESEEDVPDRERSSQEVERRSVDAAEDPRLIELKSSPLPSRAALSRPEIPQLS